MLDPISAYADFSRCPLAAFSGFALSTALAMNSTGDVRTVLTADGCASAIIAKGWNGRGLVRANEQNTTLISVIFLKFGMRYIVAMPNWRSQRRGQDEEAIRCARLP